VSVVLFGVYPVTCSHDDGVEDVTWHLKVKNLFGSVGEDCKFMTWNLHTNKLGSVQIEVISTSTMFSNFSLSSVISANVF
jgi:hypothetical protein